MRRSRLLGLFSAVGILLLGCDPTPVAPPGDLTATLDHRGTPHGGGSNGGHPGDGDASGSFDLTITEGLDVEETGIELAIDRKQRIKVEFAGGDWHMTQTHYWAELERTDPGAADVCYFEPADIDDAVKQQLVATLVAVGAEGSMSVHKVDGRGNILAGAGTWSALGNDPDATGQEDNRAYVDDGGSGVDWNDASATRVFRFTGGVWRALVPIGDNGVSHPKLKCANQDVVIATVAPAAGG